MATSPRNRLTWCLPLAKEVGWPGGGGERIDEFVHLFQEAFNMSLDAVASHAHSPLGPE